MTEGKKGAVGSKKALIDCVKVTQVSDPDLTYMYLPYLGVPQAFESQLSDVQRKELAVPDKINSTNFWLAREKMRFQGVLDVFYTAPPFARTIEMRGDLVFHFPHMSLEQPGMIAYTPSVAYGIADRQVRVKPGKYLSQFYSDRLSAAEIKRWADLCNPAEMEILSFEHIVKAYQKGPHSCMAGSDFESELDDHHPCEAYENTDWGIAVMRTSDGTITERALVCYHNPRDGRKGWVARAYGPNGDALLMKLQSDGFVLSSWPSGAKLNKIECSGGFVAPYLDGGDCSVKDCGEHFEINQRGELEFSSASGYISTEEQVECNHCNEYYNESDMQEDFSGEPVCTSCIDNYFVWAYCSSRFTGRQGYVHYDDTIEVNGDYYRNNSDVLELHDIHFCEGRNEYFQVDDLKFDDDAGEWVHVDDWVDKEKDEHTLELPLEQPAEQQKEAA